MFHVALFSFLILCVAHGSPLSFDDNLAIQITSSKYRNEIQMVIAVNGSIGQQFTLSTQALSPEHGTHTLLLAQERVEFVPKMKEAIIFNDQHEGQYFVGLTHSLKSESLHFLPVEISRKGDRREVFLAALDMKMHQIDKHSLYKCHNTLICTEIDRELGRLTLTLFTGDKKDSIWYLNGNWSHQWRHYSDKIYFGGAYREDVKGKIKISLTNNKYCEFSVGELSKWDQQLDNKKYYTIEHILEWAQPLELLQHVEAENEEL